jgi:hypothetical protein
MASSTSQGDAEPVQRLFGRFCLVVLIQQGRRRGARVRCLSFELQVRLSERRLGLLFTVKVVRLGSCTVCGDASNSGATSAAASASKEETCEATRPAGCVEGRSMQSANLVFILALGRTVRV